jgi:hypothetical protein
VRATFLIAIGAGLGAVGCQPNTTRPSFIPLPEAAGTELRLPVPEATRQLAAALKADSIPPRTIRIRDGYIETDWFDSRSRRVVGNGRLGSRTVRVRAWADPGRPGSSQLTVETLYRPLLDPSLPDRELERQVPIDHPVALKVVGVLKKLVDRYGGSPGPQTEPAPTGNREPDQPDQVDDGDQGDQSDQPQ